MSVARHTIYNLAGSIAPMFVSIVTVPIYLHLVGATRYGVLSIVWLFMGYFGLFDPGLSRAATYHIARLHNASARERGDVFWTALLVNFLFGMLGGLVLYAAARPLFTHFFKMPDDMRAEVLACLPWMAASIPLSITTGVLGSVLQAREWFGISNAVNVLNTLLTQIVPIAVAYFHGPDLLWLIPAILLARAAGAVPQFIAVARALPLGAGGGFKSALLRELFSYGGWITVSNLLGPILMSADRMLIGSVLNIQNVTYYSVPFFLVSRISVLPAAFVTSMFPKLARTTGDEVGIEANVSTLWLVAVMTPIIVFATLCLPLFMHLWMGRSFALKAVPIGSILLFGMWLNAVAIIPYNFLQATNRPDLTAIFHLIELVPFVIILWIGLHWFGLNGAAWAWDLRMLFDVILLLHATGQLKIISILIPGAMLVILAPLLAPSKILSPVVLLAAIALLLSTVWGWSLSPVLRGLVRNYLQRLPTVRNLN